MGFQKWIQVLFNVMLLVAIFYLSFYVFDLKSEFLGFAEVLKGIFSSSTIGYGA